MTNGLLRPKGSFFCPHFALCGLLGKLGGNPPSAALLGVGVCRRPAGSLRPSISLILPHLGLVRMVTLGTPFLSRVPAWSGSTNVWKGTQCPLSSCPMPTTPPTPPPGSVFCCEAPSSSHLLPDPDVGEGGDNCRGVWVGVGGR